ncbi:MAG TPA: hypothetical protein PLB59_06190 [Bacteroidales bacterium]|nr:hypothetical protein [Bacteroidales bacterium]HPB25055.1 hypothetical protein [Bacteroidales bacterium]HQP15538.1 hypothetical protein [Bacteroidales bacterium]
MKNNFTYTLCMLLLLAPLYLFSQKETLIKPQYQPISDKHRNTIDELGRKQGLWKYYTRDKTLVMEISFQNDVKHGPCIRHSSATGAVIEESNYFNGRRDGEYKRYDIKGTIISEGQYVNGRKSGKWTTYYTVNGEKKSEGEYQSGKREGVWANYNSKGTLRAKGAYKYGLREGEWIYYYANGTVAETKTYIKGKAPEEVKQPKQPEPKVVKGFVMTPKKKKETPGENKKTGQELNP